VLKRVAMFLALLALGGLVLWWLDRRSARPTPADGSPSRPALEVPDALTPAPQQQGELTPIETGKDKSGQYAHSGPFEVFLKELDHPDQPLWLHVKALDSRTLGDGSADLMDVELEHYDLATRKLDLAGRAGRARAKVSRLGELDTSAPIPVRDAQVTYHSASRFSPLRIETPQLELHIDDELALSDEMVTLAGVGFSASGRGLRLDGGAEELTLRSEPRARFELEQGREALLEGRGTLVARSRPDLVDTLGPEAVSVQALDGAKLTIGGDTPLQVDARSIVMYGSVERATSSFRPKYAEATGQVHVNSGADGWFESERLVLDFDAQGKPLRAAFDGSPRLELALRGRSLAAIPPELLVEGEQLTVRGDGAGPLEVFFGASQRFEFNGPARLELPSLGAQLACQTRIEGVLDDKGGLRDFAVIGDVRAERGDWRVTSERLDVQAFLDAQGRDSARLSSPGAARLSGVLEDGAELTLATSGNLVVDSARDGLTVRSASQAVVEQRKDGVRIYWARADEVRELDPVALSFLAEGAVEFVAPQGRGRGDRLEVWAVDRAELAGLPDAPARLEATYEERDWGVFEALFIEAQGELVHARGDVKARVGLDALEYVLDAPWVVVARRGASEQPATAPDLELDAGGGGVRATVIREGEEIELAGDRFEAQARRTLDERGRESYEPTLSTVTGDVTFNYRGETDFGGQGERLELRADRSARLTALPEEQVRLRGALPAKGAKFEMLATQVDFSPERVTALNADTEVEGLSLALGGGEDTPADARKLRLIAGALDCDERSIVLSESVYVGGKTARLEDWDVDCESAVIKLDTREDPQLTQLERAHELVAWGGLSLRMGSMGAARGALLELSNARRSVVISGGETAEGTMQALLERGEFLWEAPRIELNLETGYLRSDGAVVRPRAQDARDSWTLSYEALEPLPAGDDTIQIIRAPVWRSGEVEVRAAWALAWVDSAKWRGIGAKAPKRLPDPDADSGPRSKRFFGRVDLAQAQDWLHEVYLDGEVEYRIGGDNQIRAEGVYMDLIDGHGWIVDALIDIELPIGGRRYKLKVQADWLRHSLDGSMETKNAVATTCTHASPHYVFKIGTFSRTPRYVEETRRNPTTGQIEVVQKLDGYEVALEENAIDFIGPLSLPLPRIAGGQDEKNRFDPNSVSVGSFTMPSFGQDSKLGTFISANFTTEIGPLVKGFHWLLNRLFSGSISLPKPEGDTRLHADLNSRGLILGAESRFQAKDRYRWTVIFDAIYDTDDDRGLIRVDRDDREEGRAWLRTRGRYLLGPQEWLDFVVTRQTDPGVQSEFFERDYLRFEERETFAHWRRAENEYYTSATLEGRLEDFRSEVVDQPTVHMFKGRSDVGRIGALPIVQSSLLSLQNLARFEGDPRYNERPFADGLGDRSVMRLDGSTRYETPWDTGAMGLRVTPFVEGRGTGWSDNAAEDDRAGRVALITGVQASTTFWKRFTSGSRHFWTPSIAYRGDLAYADDGGPVARFDAVDDSIEGRFVDLAMRSRWEHRELASDLDLEIVQTHAESVAAGARDGWLPIVVRSTWLSRLASMPFGVSHDARYDLASGETTYSRTLFGVEPVTGLDVEVGYYRARDTAGLELYNAASVGARYAFTRKWELEGRQTFSARDSGDNLAYSFIVRRIGHDFVFELENSVVAGEGRSSLRFKFTPLFAWRNANPSILDNWRAARQ
jgi:hypothetical protein